jgi:drug/metabolite transporter (DMT)-like permease
VNGIGSLFYYNGLNYLSASVAQLLNATYLIFVVLLTRLNGQQLNRRTIVRATLALIAITLLTGGLSGSLTWLGAGLMIGNAILFAGTVVLSQRVLYEMPSPTVTLYVLTTMAVVVVMARFMYRTEWAPQSPTAIFAIFALGLTTALSRLMLFFGVKKLGSLQTVLLGIFETMVAVLAAYFLLGESLSPTQLIGMVILLISLLLVRRNDLEPSSHTNGFSMVSMAYAFNEIAFSQAFGSKVGEDVTPEEMEAIRRMMQAPPRFDEPDPSKEPAKP